MSTLNASHLPCRHCRHYQHEGRRGGHCQRLGVPVRGQWKSCPLMIPSFTPSWDPLEDIVPLSPPGSLTYLHDVMPQRSISASEQALSKSA